MKRLLLPLLLTVALALTCPFTGNVGTSTGNGSGSPVGTLLPDPQAGLESVDNYTSTLTVSFKGTRDGQALETSTTYVQTAWPGLGAGFTVFNTSSENGTPLVITVGTVGGAQYLQADSTAPCTVNWGTAAGGVEFRLASLLPAVGAARLAGEETVAGIATRHSTFDAASLDLPDDVTAVGEAWLASSGGYVVKYTLEITGGESIFGTGVNGKRTIEYSLSDVGAHPYVVYPSGCEAVLDWPAMDDAADLLRLPGMLDYTTGAVADALFAFYQQQMAPLGWELFTQVNPQAPPAQVTFVNTATGASAIVTVVAEGGSTRVTVLSPDQSPGALPTPVPGAQETAMAQNPGVRVALAFSILFNTLPAQPGPSSWHLEVTHQSPIWDGSQIAARQEEMTADVEGGNVHYTRRITPPGGSTATSEAYLIGHQEYAVVGGKVQPPAEDSLTWMLWYTNLGVILSSSSPGAASAGTETLDGRTAEIYAIHSSGLSIPGVPGSLLPITSLTGSVWVDQGTGALLKAVLDYQADVADSSGSLKGSGTGHLEIAVTQIGNVTVTLP